LGQPFRIWVDHRLLFAKVDECLPLFAILPDQPTSSNAPRRPLVNIMRAGLPSVAGQLFLN
jgi:hypothetical protein